ncbi:unnamed protein product [Nesidiocoris tenuis]|uniref:Uncharacterized protein n=1 Tax=Nesidiocoris tenuis TaxID=355587 RepID=A0A6H5HE40_9HEMI|nr:unnamed protein product [Nesidiocoris tenuis]
MSVSLCSIVCLTSSSIMSLTLCSIVSLIMSLTFCFIVSLTSSSIMSLTLCSIVSLTSCFIVSLTSSSIMSLTFCSIVSLTSSSIMSSTFCFIVSLTYRSILSSSFRSIPSLVDGASAIAIYPAERSPEFLWPHTIVQRLMWQLSPKGRTLILDAPERIATDGRPEMYYEVREKFNFLIYGPSHASRRTSKEIAGRQLNPATVEVQAISIEYLHGGNQRLVSRPVERHSARLACPWREIGNKRHSANRRRDRRAWTRPPTAQTAAERDSIGERFGLAWPPCRVVGWWRVEPFVWSFTQKSNQFSKINFLKMQFLDKFPLCSKVSI